MINAWQGVYASAKGHGWPTSWLITKQVLIQQTFLRAWSGCLVSSTDCSWFFICWSLVCGDEWRTSQWHFPDEVVKICCLNVNVSIQNPLATDCMFLMSCLFEFKLVLSSRNHENPTFTAKTFFDILAPTSHVEGSSFKTIFYIILELSVITV